MKNAGRVETYDSKGELISITNSNGLVTTLSWITNPVSGVRDLVQVNGPFGHRLTFAYTDGHLSSLTDPDGKLIQYLYDGNGNVQRVIYQDGTYRDYLYEDTRFPSKLTGIVAEDGLRFSTYSYDTQGRAASSEHAGGVERITLAYGSAQTIVTDAVGQQTTFDFAGSSGTAGRRVTAITNDAGTQFFQLGSDQQRRVTQEVDARNIVTDHGYDAEHLLWTIEASGTPNQRRTEYTYLSAEDDLVTSESKGKPVPDVAKLSPLEERCGISDCIYKHEMSHVADYNRFSKSICRYLNEGQELGMREPSRSQSEVAAWEVSIKCLLSKLNDKNCKDECKAVLKGALADAHKFQDRYRGNLQKPK